MRVSRRNIGRAGAGFRYHFNDMVRSGTGLKIRVSVVRFHSSATTFLGWILRFARSHKLRSVATRSVVRGDARSCARAGLRVADGGRAVAKSTVPAIAKALLAAARVHLINVRVLRLQSVSVLAPRAPATQLFVATVVLLGRVNSSSSFTCGALGSSGGSTTPASAAARPAHPQPSDVATARYHLRFRAEVDVARRSRPPLMLRRSLAPVSDRLIARIASPRENFGEPTALATTLSALCFAAFRTRRRRRGRSCRATVLGRPWPAHRRIGRRVRSA